MINVAQLSFFIYLSSTVRAQTENGSANARPTPSPDEKILKSLDYYVKKFMDFSDEVNGMVKFYATIDFEEGKNETQLPPMPNFEALFPDLARFVPTKGARRKRQIWRGAAATPAPGGASGGIMPYLMQMICQQQGVSTVPGPLLESANFAGNNLAGSNRPNANEFRPAPRKPTLPARIRNPYRNPYRRGKRGAGARRRRPRPPTTASSGGLFGDMNSLLPMLLLSQMTNNRRPPAMGAGSTDQNGAMTGGAAAQGANAPQGAGGLGQIDFGQLLLQSMCLSATYGQSPFGGARSTVHPPAPGHPTVAPAGGVLNTLLPSILGLDPGLGLPLPMGGGLNPLGGGLNPLGVGLNPLGGGLNPGIGLPLPMGGGLNPLGGGLNPLGGGGGLGAGAGFPSIGGPG